MSQHSTIEWTDATWNPVRGCNKVSSGCAHCYAERFAERFRGVVGHAYEDGFDPRLAPQRLLDPLRWIQPRMIFVNSMSDLFQEIVPDEYIILMSQIMIHADWHTFQVLTKRSERMQSMLESSLAFASQAQHIWWGVSVENRKQGLPRLERLRQTAGGVRFVSAEPLLEDLGPIDLSGIDWLIAGGESGPGARPASVDWFRRLRDQCHEQSVDFFFKQWGGVRKAAAGRTLDGRTHDQMPVRRLKATPDLKTRKRLIDKFTSCMDDWNNDKGLARHGLAG